MDTDESGDFWSQFVLLVSVMRELGVLSFFLEHSVRSVVKEEVRAFCINYLWGGGELVIIVV